MLQNPILVSISLESEWGRLFVAIHPCFIYFQVNTDVLGTYWNTRVVPSVKTELSTNAKYFVLNVNN